MTAVSFPIKKSYTAPSKINDDTIFPFTASSPATAPRQELSTFRYSYSYLTVLRLPFEPVCLDAPLTQQGILYPPILLYLTHDAFASAAFLTARILDSYIRDFVSISTFSPYTVLNPQPIARVHLRLAFALPFLGARGGRV